MKIGQQINSVSPDYTFLYIFRPPRPHNAQIELR